jgi:hypothetical protein
LLEEFRKQAASAAAIKTTLRENTIGPIPEMTIEPASRQASFADSDNKVSANKTASTGSQPIESRRESVIERSDSRRHSILSHLSTEQLRLRRQSTLSQWSQDFSAENTPAMQRPSANLSLRVAVLKAGEIASAAAATISEKSPVEESPRRRQRKEEFYYPGSSSPIDRETFAALIVQRYYRLYKMRQHFSKIRANVLQRSSGESLPAAVHDLTKDALEEEEVLKSMALYILAYLAIIMIRN